MTTFAARHLALGDDPEPEGLASTWGDQPVPRRALPPEDAPATTATSAPYSQGPELSPFATVARADRPFAQASPSEFGRPVVAPVPSRTMEWHLSGSSSAPRDPGPADAILPATTVVDPASVPTPVSQFAAISYQSMASPTYGSMISAPSAAVPPQPVAALKPVGPEIE